MTEKDPKPRFGTIAIKKEFITLEQFSEAIAIQAGEEVAGSDRRRIGKILIDLGFMTASQANEILQDMIDVADRFECPHCGIMIYKCPNCNTELR